MPKIYGLEHILYVAISAALMTISIILIKRFVKNDKDLRLVIRIIGLFLLAAIIWNRISICLVARSFKSLLPNTFCGSSSLFLALSAIFLPRNHKVFHCVAYVGFVGALLTLIYPDFIGQADSIFYSKTISGLVHHTIMFFLVLVMFITKYIEPDIKQIPIMMIGLSFYITYGVFLITILDYSDSMQIYHPILEGTPFNWLGLGVIFIAVYIIFLIGWKYKKRNA